MKVTIENFRCFGEKESPAERTFSESNVNLFSGVSGRGKTTTFHAVLWCMFGRARGIKPIEQGQEDPESGETERPLGSRRRTKACCPPKTRVTVELDGLVMMREKTPEVFQLEENSVILEGKIAQDRIYQLFGDEDFFIATSFLQQRGNHPLIYLPCAERFTLLYNLTFGYSLEERLTPDAYISAVAGEINTRVNDLKGLESVRDYILKAFHSQEEEAEKLEKKFEGLETQKQLKDREMEYLETVENVSKEIQTLEKKLEGTEDKYEKLIISFAYNSEKGLFLKEFADLMTSTFKEFEVEVKKVKHIAGVENECIFKDQAWAYPRNNPTQILCKGRKYECKHVEPGWDMNIISRKEAIGYIGTKLEPGQYPKCKLEAKLKGLDSIKKTVKKA